MKLFQFILTPLMKCNLHNILPAWFVGVSFATLGMGTRARGPRKYSTTELATASTYLKGKIK